MCFAMQGRINCERRLSRILGYIWKPSSKHARELKLGTWNLSITIPEVSHHVRSVCPVEVAMMHCEVRPKSWQKPLLITNKWPRVSKGWRTRISQSAHRRQRPRQRQRQRPEQVLHILGKSLIAWIPSAGAGWQVLQCMLLKSLG